MFRFSVFLLTTLSVIFVKSHSDEFDDFIKGNSSSSVVDFSVKKDKKKNDNVEIIDKNKIQSGNMESKVEIKRPKSSEEKLPPYKKSIINASKEWTALVANPKGHKVCYAVIYSNRRVGNIVEKKDIKPYFMVHYFSLYKQRVSIFFDYKIKAGSHINISIDGKQFELYPFENYAFSLDADMDTEIVSALLNSKRILVRGEGDGNQYSVDEFTSSGFAKVYSDMKKECK